MQKDVCQEVGKASQVIIPCLLLQIQVHSEPFQKAI